MVCWNSHAIDFIAIGTCQRVTRRLLARLSSVVHDGTNAALDVQLQLSYRLVLESYGAISRESAMLHTVVSGCADTARCEVCPHVHLLYRQRWLRRSLRRSRLASRHPRTATRDALQRRVG